MNGVSLGQYVGPRAYLVSIKLDGGGPWWFRLLRVFWSGEFRTDRGFQISINQIGASGPLELEGYVGSEEVTTKASFQGNARIVRRSSR